MPNIDLLYGTWKFNETLTSMPTLSINFSTIVYEKEEYFNGMQQWSNEFAYTVYINDIKNYRFVYKNSWYDESYRTIKVTTTSNETALTWLQANAVKLSDNLEELRKKKQIYNDLMNELSDVINNKAGTTGKKVLSEMVETAKTIEKGITPSGTVTITENGTHDVTNYANANVNVPIPSDYIKPSGNLEITNNGDYDVKEKESVSVNVPSSGITPTGTYEVTNNGEYDITEYAKVNVNVASSGGGENTLKKLLDYTKSCYYMFYNNTTITDLTGYINYGDTENVTNMSYMFNGCSKLETIPTLNYSAVKNFYRFAYGCSKLKKFSLENTKSSADMRQMFYNCSSLVDVSISSYISTKCEGMFYGCSSLVKIKIKFSNAGNNQARTMFYNCYSLEVVDMDSYGASSAYNVQSFLENCYSLKAIIIREFYNTVLNADSFSNCYHLTGTVNATYNPNGDKDGYIYVPSAMVDTLKSATNWSAYADQIRALEDYTVDGTTTGELDESKVNA